MYLFYLICHTEKRIANGGRLWSNIHILTILRTCRGRVTCFRARPRLKSLARPRTCLSFTSTTSTQPDSSRTSMLRCHERLSLSLSDCLCSSVCLSNYQTCRSRICDMSENVRVFFYLSVTVYLSIVRQ